MAALTILACLAALFYLMHIIWSRKKIDLPYPKGIPIFGNLFQIARQRPDLVMTDWVRTLGPVFRIRMLHRNIVVFSDYESIMEVLVKKGKDCGGRCFGWSKRAVYICEDSTSIFANNPGPQWKFLRNTLHSSVKVYDNKLRTVENVNLSVISDLVKEIRDKGSQEFNPKDNVYNAVMNVICIFLIGRKYRHEDEAFKLFKEVERKTAFLLGPAGEGAELDIMWWLRHFGNKSFKKLENLVILRRRLWKIVKEDTSKKKKVPTATLR